jgi:hypothetical protein
MKRQGKSPKNKVKPAIRCAQDLADVPFQALRLPDDGRKWQALCWMRRAVLQRLSLAANQNGASISLSVDRIANAVGISRATTFRRLDDLRALGFMQDGELNPRYHWTRIRRIDVARVLETVKLSKLPVSDSQAPVSDSPATRLRLADDPSQIAPDPTEVQTEELTEEPYRNKNIDSHSAKNASCGEFAFPFDEEDVPEPPSYMRELSEDQPQDQTLPDRDPIPQEDFEEYRGMLDSAGVYGWREPEQDNGCLRKLWELCGGDREQMRDALQYGINEDDGKGNMATVAYYAERRITDPETFQW